MRRSTTTLLTAVLLPTAGLLLAGAPAVHAQTAADSAAIRSTALDYIEGWYEGDAERMERSLHPRLAKRFQERLPDGSVRLTETSARAQQSDAREPSYDGRRRILVRVRQVACA